MTSNIVKSACVNYDLDKIDPNICHAGRKLSVIKLRNFLVFVILSYALAISPFVDAGWRNYLVLFAAFSSGLAFPSYSLSVSRHIYSALILFAWMIARAIQNGAEDELASVGLTFLYSLGYFSIGAMMARLPDKNRFACNILAWIIKAFAVLSVLQMITSLSGLPIPNIMATKGLWSYNSFAFEPSQLGRVVGLTMLSYLMLDHSSMHPAHMSRAKILVLISFFVTMLLSGSALAAMAIPLVFLLSRSLGWVVIFSLAAFILWPFLVVIDFEPLRRATLLFSSLGSMDVRTLLEADSSGASRIIPALIYVDEANPREAGFWFGYGREGLSHFFLGRIPGFGDQVPAGFIPGFSVVYGIVGFGLFLWIFILRFFSRITAPLVVFWMTFFMNSAWNTQVFWYGLILIHLAWAAERDPGFERATEDVQA